MTRLTPSQGSLRETMPETAAWIDALREAFGADSINDSIRRGLKGEPTFWASEGGTEIGTRPNWANKAKTGDRHDSN